MENDQFDKEPLRIGLEPKERELLALLVGSIAGGGGKNPLHILNDQLDGRDEEIREFLSNSLYPAIQGRVG